MNFTLLDWGFAIILVVVGIMLVSGHGDVLMGGGAVGAEERRRKYDEKKMQRAFGIGFLIMALANVITIFIKGLPASIIYTVFIILVIAGEIIYVNKYCKK